jgi:hypothetical protein
MLMANGGTLPMGPTLAPKISSVPLAHSYHKGLRCRSQNFILPGRVASHSASTVTSLTPLLLVAQTHKRVGPLQSAPRHDSLTDGFLRILPFMQPRPLVCFHRVSVPGIAYIDIGPL